MESIKETIGLAVIGVLFSLFTWALASSYIEEYNLFSMEPVSVVAVEKTGTKGLFTPPAYYVRVEFPDGKESPYLNRISKKQMTEIQIGDPITGYSARSSDFSTIRDIIFDSVFYFIGIFILSFLAFCCLVAFILSIPAMEQWEKKSHSKRQSKRKRKKQKNSRKNAERTGWRIVGVIILFCLLFLVRFVWNLIRKLLPFGKTETEAMIFDQYSYVTYRKYEDSAYELTVSFQDTTGKNIQVIKDVTRHTYQQYGIGDKLPITYFNSNPYDVFVRGTSLQDIAQAAMTVEAFIYFVIIALTVFVGWVYYHERKKKKSKIQEK